MVLLFLLLMGFTVSAQEFFLSLPEPVVVVGEAQYWGESTWTDYTIQMTLETDQLDGELSILFRVQEEGFAYGLTLTSDTIWLRRYSGRWENHMALARLRGLDLAQQSLDLTIEVQEFNTSVYINGDLVMERLDRARHFPGGYIGVTSDGPVVTIGGLTVTGTQDPQMRSVIPGYFPKGDPRAGGVEHIMLIYGNPPNRWSGLDVLSYVTYFTIEDPWEPEPRIQDWFFDTFLFLALRTPFGRAFDSPARATPAIKEDWEWYLDYLFEPERQLSAFDAAVRLGRETLGDEEYKAKVIVMIPNPMAQITEFGEIDGEMISFSPQGRTAQEVTAHRYAAVRWYMEEFLQMWGEAQFEHLEFLGFYWVEEMIHYSVPGEADLIRQTAAFIHDQDLFFYWIPWFGAAGHSDWQELGFDLAIHQPNYMFNDSIPLSRFETVTTEARMHHQGIEIEAEERIWTSLPARERFRDYLRAGVTYGYAQNSVLAYYQGVKTFFLAAMSTDPDLRAVYDDVYRFTRGQWTEGL